MTWRSIKPPVYAGVSGQVSNESGFSMIEMALVMAVVAILATVAVFTLNPAKTAYAADDAATQVFDTFREANQRAVSNRNSFRVVINLATSRISLINERTFAGVNEGATIVSPDVLIRSTPLNPLVSMAQPGAGTPQIVNPPPVPYNYNPAVYTSNVWTGHFQADGSCKTLVSGSYTPVSATFFFKPTNSQVPTLVRALTIFGPSSAIRFWAYSGTQLFVVE